MEKLADQLGQIQERHRAALMWFLDRAGTNQFWPDPFPDGTLLASKAKGIYKPNWTVYALSVRQALDGPYPDREPVTRADGTWSYLYFQEGEDPATRDSAYTNRALIECWRDKVPVGVLRQVARSPAALYRVLGLALVAGWEGGYFFLEGFSPEGHSRGRGPRAEIEVFAGEQAVEAQKDNVFDPQDVVDGRDRILASIVRRRGQPEFRRKLLEAYGGRCAITSCDVEDALEAAHIVPYRGPETNHPANGILLRADIHTLFDLGLLAIDTSTMTVVVAPSLTGTTYAGLAGKRLRLPELRDLLPSMEALNHQRTWAGLIADG